MSVACAMATAGSSSGNIRKRVVLTIEDKLNLTSVIWKIVDERSGGVQRGDIN